jgi:hypothetical protein
MEIHSEIYYSSYLILFQQMLFDSLGMHANTPRNCSCCFFSISVHITCCMTSTNPYGTACSSLLSEIHTSLCFGMHSLLQQMMSLFSARPLSCSLLFSQQECCNFNFFCSWHLTKSLFASHQDFSNLQEWMRPFSLINFMREGEEFS